MSSGERSRQERRSIDYRVPVLHAVRYTDYTSAHAVTGPAFQHVTPGQ